MNQSFPSPLLVLEASGTAGSVALFVDGALVSEREVAMGPAREDAILPAIESLLRAAHILPRDVKAIACGNGPGSFTSLRIAAALAKGLAVANGAALFVIPSLLLAAGELHDRPGDYVLHSDALRGERYAVRVHISAASGITMTNVARLSVDGVNALARESQSTVFEVGALSRSNDPSANESMQATRLVPRASAVQFLREEWNAFGPVDVASWEPDYGRLAEAQVKWETQHGRELPRNDVQ